MSDVPWMHDDNLPPVVAQGVDEACDHFEVAWKAVSAAGSPPRVEDFLGGAPDPEQSVLLRALVELDVYYRRHRGEAPGADDYLARFPTLDPAEVARVTGEGLTPTAKAERPAAGARAVPPPESAGRNLLYEEIGRGGMGTVRRGRDLSLNRVLAIKVLREDHRGSPEFERRFRDEAQITGQLQHPGIPPVHEVGTLADGRPFFTMKLVKGRTLAELLKEPAPRHDRPRFLGIFEQVCLTLAYAHSRGVIHRDLKPANVMVGAFGEVMVMDWGLAKVLTAADEESAEGNGETVIRPVGSGPTAGDAGGTGVVGTPAYMAPEQARGEAEAVDERADVFGLGAMLCVLLTGQPPYTGTGALRQATAGEVAEALARLASCGADAELVALSRECLAPRREDRPRDARVVAARVVAYQAAVQERLWATELERAAAEARVVEAKATAAAERKARRRTVGLALALLTGFVALVIGLAAVIASELKTREALEQVTKEQEKKAKALDAEEAALERSRKAEQSANEQRQLALKTVRGVVDDIHALLKERPGQQELRKALLERALAGLRELARAADTVAVIDHETVWARFDLGDIFLDIQGSSEEAKAQYQKAHDLAGQVLEASPESASAQRDLAISHQKLGDVYLDLGDRKAALGSYREALKRHQRLADADRGSLQAQRDLSVSHNKLGDVYLDLRDPKAALDSYQKALELRQRLADADKTSALAQRDLSVSYERLGDVYLDLGDRKAALDSYNRALQTRERLAAADPLSVQAQRDLSVSHQKLGDVQRRLEDPRAARHSYKKGLRVDQRLAADDPWSAQTQRDLLVSYFKLAAVAQETYDFKTALGWYGQALDIPKRFPKSEFFKQDVTALEPRVRFCRASEQAVADPATTRGLPDDLRWSVFAVATIARAGKEARRSKAVAAADRLADNAKEPGELYNAACEYALCAQQIDQPKAKEKYATRAVELLRQAVEKGYKDVVLLKKDADLDALRPRDDFKKLLADLEAATKPKDKQEP